MGNNRGDTYGREHVTYNVSDKEFWDFTFTEMGTIDLPDFVDYIRN